MKAPILCALMILLPGIAHAQAPDISVTPDSADFGTVAIGDSRDRAFAVSNTSADETLVVSASEIRGNDADEFAIVGGQGGVILGPGENHLITIRFTPTSPGLKRTTFHLESNDPDENPIDIPLAGTGGTLPDIAVDPPSLFFENTPVDSAVVQEIVIANEGLADLEITASQLSGPDAERFEIVRGGAPLKLGAQERDTLAIRFRPPALGQYNAQLQLFSNDPDENPLQVPLTGVGASAEISIDTPGHDFGDVVVGATASLNFLILNTGTGSLVVPSSSIDGPGSEQFIVTAGEPPFTVDPGQVQQITVLFAPTEAGLQEAALTLVTNDPDEQRFAIPLSGTGTTIQIELADIAMIGTDVSIQVNMPAGFAPDRTELFYRSPGEAAYRMIELTNTDNTFRGEIPGLVVQASGVEYYLAVFERDQVITVPALQPLDRPLFLPTRVEQMDAPLTAPAWSFQMISVPMQLDDRSIDAVLEDDYGPYNTRRWRLFRWGDASYAEYPDIATDFEPGAGFWLVTNDGAAFDVEGGRSTDPTRPLQITLQPGWNQIGNPYSFAIAWPAATIDPRIDAPVAYDGVEFQYEMTTLEPWTGYFVENLAEIPVEIALSALPAAEAGKRRADPLSYRLRFLAESVDRTLRDTQTFVGLSESAQPDRDSLDVGKAPPIGDYIRLAVEERGVRFAGNVKPAGDEGQTWDLSLDASSALPIRVRLVEEGLLPEGFSLHLVDLDRRTTIVPADSSFAIDTVGPGAVRRLRAVIGLDQFVQRHTDGFAREPARFRLDQNYPNPFARATSISYEVGAPTDVRLDIYNALGQRIRTIRQAARDAGAYTIAWDGKSDGGATAASGVYLYRLTAGDFTATRNMLLIR